MADPAVGTVEQGYRFKGGGPASDPNNWEVVQEPTPFQKFIGSAKNTLVGLATALNPETYKEGELPAGWHPEAKTFSDRLKALAKDLPVVSDINALRQGQFAEEAGRLAVGALPVAMGVEIPTTKIGTAVKAGAKAAAPDVAIGAGKAALGAAIAEKLPGDNPLKYIAGAAPVYSGMRQIGRGISKGFATAKGSLAEKVQAAVDATKAPETAAETPGQALARSTGQDWSKLGKTDQQMLEQVAKAQANAAAQAAPQTAAEPPATQPPVAPASASPAAEPVAESVPAPAPQPLRPPLRTPPPANPVAGREAYSRALPDYGPIEPTAAGTPLRPPLRVATPVETPATQVETPLARTLPQVEAAMVQKQPAIQQMAEEAQSPYTATGERKSPATRAQEITAANIVAKAQRFAQALHKAGVTADEASQIPAGRLAISQIAKGGVPGWGNIADSLGEATEPAQSVPVIIQTLRKLERQASGAAPPEIAPVASQGAGATGAAEPAAETGTIRPPEGFSMGAMKNYGISERLQDTADAAMQRIRDRGTLSGSKLSAGVPVDDLADMAIWGAAKIAKGTVDFAKWSKEMIADAGEAIRPHLQDLWDKAQKIYGKHVDSVEGGLPNTKQLLKLYKEGEGGADWYAKTKEELSQHFGQDTDKIIDFLAATSPNATVASNVSLALKAYKQWKTGQPFEGYLPAVKGLLEKAANGEDFGGLKVSSFAKNLHGNPLPVTIDRWIARAFGLPDNPNPGQYKFMDYTLSQIAKRSGMEPRQLQAAIWTAIKEKQQSIASNTSLPFEKLLPQRVAADPAMQALIANAKGAPELRMTQ